MPLLDNSDATVKRWPGFTEWALVLTTTALGAAEFQTQSSRERIQSATAYYFQYPSISNIHLIALVIDGLIFAIPVLWILTPAKKLCRNALGLVVFLGFALCWYEAIYASRLESNIITLPTLPFSPINNYGLIGAQVFGTYIILSLPTSKGNKLVFAFIRVALAMCLWFAQLAIWTVITR